MEPTDGIDAAKVETRDEAAQPDSPQPTLGSKVRTALLIGLLVLIVTVIVVTLSSDVTQDSRTAAQSSASAFKDLSDQELVEKLVDSARRLDKGANMSLAVELYRRGKAVVPVLDKSIDECGQKAQELRQNGNRLAALLGLDDPAVREADRETRRWECAAGCCLVHREAISRGERVPLR